MPTPTRAKPPVPAWIIRERKRLGLKPRDLAERLTAAGLSVTEGTVRTWEAGRRPHPDNVEGLERIFGTRSPDYMAETPSDTGVSAYLETVNALVEQMAEDRKLMLELLDLVRPTADRAEQNSAHIRALEAELQSLRARSGSGA